MAAILTLAVLTIGTAQLALAKDDSRVKIEGEFGNVDGKTKFESRDIGDRVKFSVEITGVAIDSAFTIDAAGTSFATTSNEFGIIDFNLDTRCEDDGSDCSDIPNMSSGDKVTVTGTDFFAQATLN